jgi:transcriptional regulator
VSPLILRIVALEPTHGCAIARRLESMTEHGLHVPEGSLYPGLHRLEHRGFLVSEWRASETGREAKFYRLTAEGEAQRARETQKWERLSALMRMVLYPEGDAP